MLDQICKLSELFLKASGKDPLLEQLSNQKSFTAAVRFASLNWPKLSSGSSRVVFDYNPDLVLKIAKNNKGQAQNRVENDSLIQSSYKDIVTNVADYDSDDKWLLVQKAKKIGKKRFQELTGFNFDDFGKYFEYRINLNERFKPLDNDRYKESEFIDEILDLMVNFAMPIGDITRISSWGEVNGKAVLTDYGLTEDIMLTYYR